MEKKLKKSTIFWVLGTVAWLFMAGLAIFGLTKELSESNQELLATREVLEKLKLDLGDAEEEAEKNREAIGVAEANLEKVLEENLALKLVAVAFLKERDGTIAVPKKELSQLLDCCRGKIQQQKSASPKIFSKSLRASGP